MAGNTFNLISNSFNYDNVFNLHDIFNVHTHYGKVSLVHSSIYQQGFFHFVYLFLNYPFHRYGSSGNPEFLIGWKSTFMTLATLSFICPLFMVMKKSIPYIVPSVLNIVTVISVILVTATPLGFPYSANPNSLAPHR